MRHILVVAMIGTGGCTALWGIDDLSYQPNQTTSTATTGGSGGVGGATSSAGGGGTGGSGGTVTLCNDALDVSPVTMPIGIGAPIAIAAAYDVVGSVWVHDPTGNAIKVVMSTKGGVHISDDDAAAVANASRFQPSIAVGNNRFAVFVPHPTSAEVRLFDPDSLSAPLTPSDVVGIPYVGLQTGDPMQGHVVAGNGSFFVSVVRDGGDFFHALLSAPLWTPTAVAPFGSDACCCNARNWAVAGGDSFHVAWRSTCGGLTWEYQPFDASGMAAMSPRTIDNVVNPPKYAFMLGQELVLANCSEVVHLDAGGTTLGRIPLPGTGPCAIASTGNELRWAVNDAGMLRWHALDLLTGVGAELLSFPLTSNSSVPMVTHDGSGFAVMWNAAGQPGYARIACE